MYAALAEGSAERGLLSVFEREEGGWIGRALWLMTVDTEADGRSGGGKGVSSRRSAEQTRRQALTLPKRLKKHKSARKTTSVTTAWSI